MVTNLQGLAELASAHTEVDQHLKHGVVRLAPLLPELTQHIQRRLSIVESCISLQEQTQPFVSLLSRHDIL